MNRLKNAKILVTRPAHQAKNLCQMISQWGGNAILFPTIEIVASGDIVNTQSVLANLKKFQWLIFISANAVNFALQANGGKIVGIETIRIAAIGSATANALEIAGIPVDLLPANGYDSEALLANLEIQAGKHCLIVRGQGGREELADTLRKKGVNVDYLETYKRTTPNSDKSPVIKLLSHNELDVITITSGEALENLLSILGKDYHQRLFAIPLVVISERIRTIAAQRGFKRIAVTKSPSDSAIIDTVITIINEE